MQHLIDRAAETSPIVDRKSQRRAREVRFDRHHAAGHHFRGDTVLEQTSAQSLPRFLAAGPHRAVQTRARSREQIGSEARAEETGRAGDQDRAAVEEATSRSRDARPHLVGKHGVCEHLVEGIGSERTIRRRSPAFVNPCGELSNRGGLVRELRRERDPDRLFDRRRQLDDAQRVRADERQRRDHIVEGQRPSER